MSCRGVLLVTLVGVGILVARQNNIRFCHVVAVAVTLVVLLVWVMHVHFGSEV